MTLLATMVLRAPRGREVSRMRLAEAGLEVLNSQLAPPPLKTMRHRVGVELSLTSVLVVTHPDPALWILCLTSSVWVNLRWSLTGFWYWDELPEEG